MFANLLHRRCLLLDLPLQLVILVGQPLYVIGQLLEVHLLLDVVSLLVVAHV